MEKEQNLNHVTPDLLGMGVMETDQNMQFRLAELLTQAFDMRYSGDDKFQLAYEVEGQIGCMLTNLGLKIVPALYQAPTLAQLLKKRIAELRKADAYFCEKRWDMSQPEMIRKLMREQSNCVTLARQELEQMLAQTEPIPA